MLLYLLCPTITFEIIFNAVLSRLMDYGQSYVIIDDTYFWCKMYPYDFAPCEQSINIQYNTIDALQILSSYQYVSGCFCDICNLIVKI